MILYHGSYAEIRHPDLKHSRPNLDFGRGFYTTPIYGQAANWCRRFKQHGAAAFISVYEFDETAYNQLKVLHFDTYSEEWLDFILTCRAERDTFDYDIVIGGVANDRVFNTVELYFDNLIDKREAIKRLRYEKPNLQLCFRTEHAIEGFLFFKESECL